jgi:hypothetical protein
VRNLINRGALPALRYPNMRAVRIELDQVTALMDHDYLTGKPVAV